LLKTESKVTQAFKLFDSRKIRDLAPECLDQRGQLRIMPASYYANATVDERAWFAFRYGFYSLPTLELVDWLQHFIDGRPAIEVGSGNGALARALGIPATDSYEQERPDIKRYYELLYQPTVQYAADVEKLEALEAIEKYQPKVVIAAWVGYVDVPAIIRLAGNYVLMGNLGPHGDLPMRSLPHDEHFFPWLYSRAFSGKRDFIGVWRR
jgi:hypothetical protein